MASGKRIIALSPSSRTAESWLTVPVVLVLSGRPLFEVSLGVFDVLLALAESPGLGFRRRGQRLVLESRKG